MAVLIDMTLAQTAKAYRMLSAACNVALNDGIIGRHPCAVRGGSQDRSAERRTLAVDEALRLADEIDSALRVFVLLAAFGGLRRSQLLGLQRQDIDLDGGTVRIERAVVFPNGERTVKAPKSDAGRRTVALPGFMVDDLAHHLDRHAEAGWQGVVFVGEKGSPLSPSTLNNLAIGSLESPNHRLLRSGVGSVWDGGPPAPGSAEA